MLPWEYNDPIKHSEMLSFTGASIEGQVKVIIRILSFIIIEPPVEPTCANAKWAHMHCFLSVCLSGHLRMSLLGAKVFIWLQVGC